MKLFLLSALLLILNNSLTADQTFEQETANKKTYYYGVTYQLEMVETGTPTDFYVSELDIQSDTWTPISSTFGWGNFDPSIIVEYTPTSTFTNGYLGIHTGTRNSGTFSVVPTDVTDVSVEVIYSTATFTEIESIWYNDVFNLYWTSNTSTLPKKVNLEYKTLSSTSWTVLGDIDVHNGTIGVHNEFAKEDVKFRLAYIGVDYSIAETDYIAFLYPSMTITNKQEVESYVFKDGDAITINFETERVTEYMDIDVYVNGALVSKIPFDSKSYTYTSQLNTDEIVSIEFYTEMGFLGDVVIISEDKWFEVGPVGSEYKVMDKIDITWSYSKHFKYVDTYIKINSETEYTKLNNKWTITSPYSYVVKDKDSTLQFKFVTTDEYTTLIEETDLVYIIEDCKQDSLELLVKELNLKIDSLSNVEPTIIEILTVLIKDIPLDVEDESDYYVDGIEIINITDDNLYLDNSKIYSHVYISNYTGNVVYNESGTGITDNIDISNMSSGVYFLITIDFNGFVKVFKFTKI